MKWKESDLQPGRFVLQGDKANYKDKKIPGRLYIIGAWYNEKGKRVFVLYRVYGGTVMGLYSAEELLTILNDKNNPTRSVNNKEVLIAFDMLQEQSEGIYKS